jgi:hypothetical protein
VRYIRSSAIEDAAKRDEIKRRSAVHEAPINGARAVTGLGVEPGVQHVGQKNSLKVFCRPLTPEGLI